MPRERPACIAGACSIASAGREPAAGVSGSMSSDSQMFGETQRDTVAREHYCPLHSHVFTYLHSSRLSAAVPCSTTALPSSCAVD